MAVLVATAVILGWVCQQPLVPDVGTGRAQPSYHWVVQADAGCREPTLKPGWSENPAEAERAEAYPAASRDRAGFCGEPEIRRALVYFEPGSAEPLYDEAAKLAPLMAGRSLVLAIRGYTDASGPEAVNQRLSRARAAAVWRLWKAMGGPMPLERVVIQGLGECCPRGQDPAADRRVELEVVLEPSCLHQNSNKEVTAEERATNHTSHLVTDQVETSIPYP